MNFSKISSKKIFKKTLDKIDEICYNELVDNINPLNRSK